MPCLCSQTIDKRLLVSNGTKVGGVILYTLLKGKLIIYIGWFTFYVGIVGQIIFVF